MTMVDKKVKIESVSIKDKKNIFFSFLPILIILSLSFILPIIFLPIDIASIYSVKNIIFINLTALSLFIAVILKLKDNHFILPFNLISLSILLIPIFYLLSSFFSTNTQISFFSSSFDSSLNIIIVFVLLFLISILFQKSKYIKYLYISILSSILLINIFHVIKLPFFDFIPNFNFFLTQTSNTIGKWYDLAVFSGIGLILSFISIDFINSSCKKIYKIFLYIIFSLSLILLIIINFNELWFVVSAISILFFIYVFINNNFRKINKINKLSLFVFLISFVFIISGFRISPIISNYLGINFIEARPSMPITYNLAKESLIKNPILGYGPSRFDIAWIENKPSEINESDFWNVDFKFGYGFIPTLIVNIGILGIIPWVMFFLLYLFFGLRFMFLKKEENENSYFTVSSFLVSLYLWILNFIYVPNITTLAITSIFTGVFLACLYRENILKSKKINITSNPRIGFIYIFILIVILILSITASYISISKFTGDIYYQKTLKDLNSNNLESATYNIIKTLQFDQNDLYFRTLSNIKKNNLSLILNNQNLSNEDKVKIFQEVLSNSIQSAQAAISYDPYNYINYTNLASIYESLLPLNIQGVYENSKQNYLIAKEKNKDNPEIYISLARLEIYNKNYESARSLISESLKIKSNYTEAIYLLAQIDVLEGKIEEAILKVEQAVLLKPNDPGAYFQLGLLRYENKQYLNSVSAFENAVIRDPYYSNAKYFLGLSYYQLGRNNEAASQFEDLVILNPDNQEIKNILEKIKTGQLIIKENQGEAVEDLPIEDNNGNQE